MMRTAWLPAALCLASASAWAQPETPAPEENAPAVEAPKRLRPTCLHDVTADVLPPGQGQFNLFYLQYSRGLLPGLQLSSHLAGFLITLANVTGEYQFLDRPELRASIEVGGYWLALSQLLKTTIVQVHAIPRATVPLPAGFELTLAAEARALILDAQGVSQNTRDLRGELSLVHEDIAGAWLVQARFPILTQQTMTLAELLGKTNVSGSLVLDDLSSWSIVVARDSGTAGAHFRIGAGYRNRPGVFFVDSFGPVILFVDLYWR